MDNGFLIFLPNIILIILFIIFLWWRHSLKSLDWVTFISITLGVFLLAIVIIYTIKNQSTSNPLNILLIAIPAILFILFLLFMTRVLTVEKVKSKFHFDERITIMNAKSARNALAAIYLSSVIYLIIYSSISTTMFSGILGASLIVYLASMVIYYFRSF